jgi:hypothetical protein
MKIKDEKLTLQAISYLEKCEGCLASIKSQPCTDYEARFSAYLRVKKGLQLVSMVDFEKVSKHFAV